jgi:hypothetical protein
MVVKAAVMMVLRVGLVKSIAFEQNHLSLRI